MIPIPIIDPVDTWVVETGSPNLEARHTSKDVVRFAENPSWGVIGVTLSESVSVTLSPDMILPSPMETDTNRKHSNAENSFWRMDVPKESATIFGASFNPLAKLVMPDDTQWKRSNNSYL